MRFAPSLRSCLSEGYSFARLGSDFKAALTVAIVALPLAMALGVASGVRPENGLNTVIIGGTLVALLGGSRFQVTGPTAAFVVILVPVTMKFGLAGLLVAGFLSGLFLMTFGLCKLGSVIQYIPYPVTTGFTSGIALVIAVLQIKDFLGLTFTTRPEHFWNHLYEIGKNLPTLQIGDAIIGLLTLALLIVSTKKIRKLPAPVIALTLATVFSVLLKLFSINIQTIVSRFPPGIPRGTPAFGLPWLFADTSFESFPLTWESLQAILPSAFSISLLGAIESLLSAVVADGMTNQRHDPNAELFALGVGNMICPFFGGIPATGAIARTSTNIRFGATSPIAGSLHGVVVLAMVCVLGPLINFVPMAALAALLMYIAYNMAEKKHFVNILKNAPTDDRAVLLTCFFLTVIFDMTIGVAVGVSLASVLFIKRMSELTSTEIMTRRLLSVKGEATDSPQALETGSPTHYFYHIRGSLFFGAAQRAIEALTSISHEVKEVVLDLTEVPLIDATGLVALDSTLQELATKKITVKMIIKSPQVFELVKKLKTVQTNPTLIYLEIKGNNEIPHANLSS